MMLLSQQDLFLDKFSGYEWWSTSKSENDLFIHTAPVQMINWLKEE